MFTVKICGLTNIDDARWALEEGADYLGFVMYPKSPRYVTPENLAHIVDHLPEHACPVGVFVNEEPILVKQIVSACRLVAVQLNGDEDPADFRDLGVPLWRSVRLEEGRWSPSPEQWKVDRFVLDVVSPAYGGTGEEIDWKEGRKFASQHRAMLAGGLRPETVAEAIRQVRPIGVDVSSGVESLPGKKDFRKVAAFIANARAAAGVIV
jgi:phosphoribosylanthranilate isomerase